MLQVFGLILIAVLHAGSAVTVEELQKKIAETKKATAETLKNVTIVNKQIATVEDQIVKYDFNFHKQTSKLTQQEKAIISNMIKLNAKISTTESSIKYFEKQILIEKQIGYRLSFIVRLFTEDLGLILEPRKTKGEEKACFEFAKNKTTLEKSSVKEIQVDVASDISPQDRNKTILEAELRQVQRELEYATRKLALAKDELQARTQQLKRTISTGQKAIGDLIESVRKDKEAEKTLEKDFKEKNDKLNKIKVEVNQENAHNYKLRLQIQKLKSEHDKFKKAIECYKHLENTF